MDNKKIWNLEEVQGRIDTILKYAFKKEDTDTKLMAETFALLDFNIVNLDTGGIDTEKINQNSDLIKKLEEYYNVLGKYPIKIYKAYYRNYKKYWHDRYWNKNPLYETIFCNGDSLAYYTVNNLDVSVQTGHIEEHKVYCVGELVPIYGVAPECLPQHLEYNNQYEFKEFAPYEVKRSREYKIIDDNI